MGGLPRCLTTLNANEALTMSLRLCARCCPSTQRAQRGSIVVQGMCSSGDVHVTPRLLRAIFKTPETFWLINGSAVDALRKVGRMPANIHSGTCWRFHSAGFVTSAPPLNEISLNVRMDLSQQTKACTMEPGSGSDVHLWKSLAQSLGGTAYGPSVLSNSPTPLCLDVPCEGCQPRWRDQQFGSLGLCCYTHSQADNLQTKSWQRKRAIPFRH
jgi:hypothetical protein